MTYRLRTVTSSSGSSGVSIREYQYSTVPEILEALQPFGVSLSTEQLQAQATGDRWQATMDKEGSRTQLTVFLSATDGR
ncbi:hypothetical protein OHB26_35080 [Nocardia sp. NBC_01503]|uniref:hypothetical protein n=1 Tax=Nocardia sp. NBC_01503 TaxID=2975997 RepID=UPI002E7B06C3|nr:hypothetical protein [Nocardia sp. NBC_01503]WTL32064.1 hypothetical protein OHB26_35080 [Nocardia sp. NBC_01503]